MEGCQDDKATPQKQKEQHPPRATIDVQDTEFFETTKDGRVIRGYRVRSMVSTRETIGFCNNVQ